MGAWGPALYSDDIACDVRDDFRDLVGDGLSGEEASNRLLQEWSSELDDSDSGPVFWLALADTQWRCGRLEPRVKARAEAIIADKSDLARWQEDPSLLRKREAVLAKLAEKLASPPPPPKKLPKRFRNHCDWAVGELIAYELLSGQKVIFRV
ncbi:MAG TPA: hypothetical protein VFW40_00440, partial [Capsulimonadaceae bacterium]|nr:hypothetical protein [Capsulimonadaceae bacterium]